MADDTPVLLGIGLAILVVFVESFKRVATRQLMEFTTTRNGAVYQNWNLDNWD